MWDAEGFRTIEPRRWSSASASAPQQLLVDLLHDPRFAALFLRARGDAAGPFGALHLGFGRLMSEAAPYIVDACWRFVWGRCLSRKSGPSGKNERAEQGYSCSQNGCACQVSRSLARRPTVSRIRAGYGKALADTCTEIAPVRLGTTEQIKPHLYSSVQVSQREPSGLMSFAQGDFGDHHASRKAKTSERTLAYFAEMPIL
ncbi:MAG TPA: hypothetical protein VMB73_31335 [Acetobacteraceae bacterium]|jgi:hypothetical protein|nr:hypothetical protein [Acetobacteraceae bacterium]